MDNLVVLGAGGGIGKAVVEQAEKVEGYDNVFGLTSKEFRYPRDTLMLLDKYDPTVIVNCIGVILPSSPRRSYTNYTDAMIEEARINYILPVQLLAMYPSIRHVNVGSSAANNPRKNWAGYCASKAALHMFTKCAYLEGYDIYCVAPGRTDTKMRRNLFGKENPETLLTPEEVARVILTAAKAEYSHPVINVKKADGWTHVYPDKEN